MPTHQSRSRYRRTTTPKSGPVSLGKFRNWITGTSGGVPFARWADVFNNETFHSYQDLHILREMIVDELHKGPPYRSGGPFKSLKMWISDPYGGVYGFGDYLRLDDKRRYIGGFRSPESSQFGLNFTISDIDLHGDSPHFPSMDGWSNAAWAGTKPKLEKAGGAVFAAELRDLPRMLKTTSGAFHDIWKSVGGNSSSRRMAPKKAADHFLNHQFGWKPFLSDLRKFDNVIQNRAKIIEDLSSKNGEYVRRRVTLRDDTTTERISSGNSCILFPNSTFNATTPSTRWWPTGSTAHWELREEVKTLVTASGKFRFYRPEFDKAQPDYSSGWNSAMRHATIAGLRVNPSNLYKATPWSWAIDWFVNVGDHIDHLNDILVDSIACQYLYVMQHKIRTRKLIQVLPFKSGAVSLEFSRIIETKQREPISSPFGPSLTWETLSPRQLAIAAALGISRKG